MRKRPRAFEAEHAGADPAQGEGHAAEVLAGLIGIEPAGPRGSGRAPGWPAGARGFVFCGRASA